MTTKDKIVQEHGELTSELSEFRPRVLDDFGVARDGNKLVSLVTVTEERNLLEGCRNDDRFVEVVCSVGKVDLPLSSTFEVELDFVVGSASQVASSDLYESEMNVLSTPPTECASEEGNEPDVCSLSCLY